MSQLEPIPQETLNSILTSWNNATPGFIDSIGKLAQKIRFEGPLEHAHSFAVALDTLESLVATLEGFISVCRQRGDLHKETAQVTRDLYCLAEQLTVSWSHQDSTTMADLLAYDVPELVLHTMKLLKLILEDE